MFSLLDHARIDLYARAIARVVRPGAVVIDLGDGPGLLALLALRAGAAHVHAINPDPAVHLLSDLARENAASGKVTIHPHRSFEVALGERADILLTGASGRFPLSRSNLSCVRDARTRLLRDGGAIVAERDRLCAAFVESDDLWRMLEPAWRIFEDRRLSASAVQRCVLDDVYDESSARVASDVLSTPRSWAEIDHRSNQNDVFEATFETEMTRSGTAHALALWSETTLHGDITALSSRMLLPLLAPTPVVAGGHARVTLRADEGGTRWAWDWELAAADGTQRAHRQSTFFGRPSDAATLLRASSAHRPRRSLHGERLLHVLREMDGERSVAELAERARERVPADSPLRNAIMEEVRSAVTRYGR